MVTIDQNGRIYTPPSAPSPGPSPQPPSRASTSEAQTVNLDSSRNKASAVTYSNPSEAKQLRQNAPAAAFSDAPRELKPASSHPKALIASQTFLDIAHFDGGTHLVDAYA